ncbi:EAL domain-containing protein [Neisseriaceae bacterium B2N2-7]|uniref:EAL domain-containing protein n=2 Tax=Craterilacuibacter sinensis TaxID=2686017 RepID=A0A845BJF6_9NEIS|nr:EAL domain-containing protein [Craterilacuibacter sinensis]
MRMMDALENNGRLIEGAREALALLRQAGPMDTAAIWLRQGRYWHCLASDGAGTLSPHPAPASLPEGAVRHELSLNSRYGVMLLWHGAVHLAQSPWCQMAGQLLLSRLEGAVLEQALVRSRLEQHILLDIATLASHAQSMEAFLARLPGLLSQLIPACDLVLTLSDEGGGLLHLSPVPLAGESGQKASAARPAELAGALATAVCMAAKPRLLDTRRILAFCVQADLPSLVRLPRFCLCLPLLICGDQAYSALTVQVFDPAQRYDRQSLSLFLRLARHVASLFGHVCERYRLVRTARCFEHELEANRLRLHAEQGERHHAQKLMRALFGIANLSNSSLSLPAFLAGVHRELQGLLSCSGCMVALYDAEQDRLTFPYGADAFVPNDPMMTMRAGPVEQVLHSGRTLLLNGSALLRSISGKGGEGLVSWLGVPVYSNRELKGVVAVFSRDSNLRYSYREQELLESVADHIGGALTQLQASAALQLANSALEERVRERTLALDTVNARLKHDTLHDVLTGLPNRAYFNQTLQSNWQAYSRDGRQCFAVLFIDLDRFKLINDTLGHQAGDALLHEAGARIRHCLRPHDFLARLGGDEFALILQRVESTARSEQIAQRIVDEFERPMLLGGREVFATVSIGAVLADSQYYQRAEDLLRDADLAMYRTKQSGRHGYTLFNHHFRENQADLLALEADLRRALDVDDQLIPYYQPFIDSHSQRLTGFEALVRWHHPERGLISPAEFLPMAQESGLIRRLDRYMIEQGCAQLAAWHDEGYGGETLSLHINLSSENLRDTSLPSWLEALLTRLALPPALLYLEVTESALIDMPEVAAQVMHALHQLGVRLALDDFGTGYSALAYLHRYQFDVLKIDQAFVREVDVHTESRAIVRAILALAQALHLDVVAEGVETFSQLSALRELGCPKLQGYYFARPQPAAAIAWEGLQALALESPCCH